MKWLPFFQLQCKIDFDKERRQFFICDVGSRNGTFLNGLRLSEVSAITAIYVNIRNTIFEDFGNVEIRDHCNYMYITTSAIAKINLRMALM